MTEKSRFLRVPVEPFTAEPGLSADEMLAGACRFSELRGAIPDISDRMLCARLRGLEEEGIVERLVHPETPVRVEYQLTGKGRELEQVFAAVDRWAGKWVDCSSSTHEGPEAA